ncbi:MAG: putative PEP-binding protein, partial [Gammaproteobacteria bacterium]
MTDSPSGTPHERVLRGIGVTRGIAIAPLHVLSVEAAAAPVRAKGSPSEERAALTAALAGATAELGRLAATLDDEAAAIIEFQMALAEDDELIAPVRAAVDGGAVADVAWAEVMDREIDDYAGSGDETLCARAADLADLKVRVQDHLCGRQAGNRGSSHPGPAQPSIFVTTDLAPSRFLALDPDRVAGIALEHGSRTSHVALLARARGIVMVSGISELADEQVLDGHRGDAVLNVAGGRLILNPGALTLSEARRAARVFAKALERAADFVSRPAVTGSGERVQVMVNVDHPTLLDKVQPGHCDGIGLTRTEFLFSSGLPDEDTQRRAYERLIEWAHGRPVTIRTLDAGGDKPVPGLTRAH